MSKKRLWDNYQEVGYVQKTEATRLLVSACVRDGVRYILFRDFYKRKKDDVWMPGRDGMTIPLTIPVKQGTELIHPHIGLVEMIGKAAEVAGELELVDEEHAVYIEKKEKTK